MYGLVWGYYIWSYGTYGSGLGMPDPETKTETTVRVCYVSISLIQFEPLD